MKTSYKLIITLALIFYTTFAIGQDCSSAQDCYQKAQTLGYTEEALTYLVKAELLWTEADGKEKMLWILKARGNTYFSLKNYPKAIQDYNKMIQLQPEDKIQLAEAFLSRGNVMGMSGNGQGAIASFTKAIEIAPPNIIAVMNRAMAYKNADMEAECIADYKRAAELGSATAISYLYYDYKNDYRDTQKAALTKDTGWQAIEKLKANGEALINSKDYDGALEAYVEAEKLLRQRGDNENNIEAVVEQAYIYRMMGNYSAAISNASRAAYNQAGTESAYAELGYALYVSGDQMGGVEACMNGMKRFPNSTSIADALIWMYSTSATDFYNKKDYATAYSLYYKAYEANRDKASAILNAAHAAYAGKFYKEALNAYYIAVGINPSLKEEAKPYIDYLKTVVE